MLLTERDHQIVRALTTKVRLLSLRQIVEHWWSGEAANGRRRLKMLAAEHMVERITVSSRTLPPVEAPLATWQPGECQPDFGGIAYHLQARWRSRAVRPQTAYIATQKAAQLYGGKSRGELKQPLQATHDLGVAAIWLCLDRQAPAWADAWLGEDLMAHTRRGQKLPDAFIVDEAGETAWLLEFGGAYSVARVEAFHADCQYRDLPYQIW